MFFVKNKRSILLFVFLIIVVSILVFIWLRGGFDAFLLDTDLGRDLSEMSNIRTHKLVWLGPQLSASFPASPVYYYIFFPALWIANWNANALIVFNIIFALITLFVLLSLCLRRYRFFAFVIISTLGLFPWFKISAIHPGNGYSYVFWLLLSVICLWYKKPIFISSFFAGLAISYHPASVFILPIIVYEWWKNKHKLLNFLKITIALLLPWTPIIIFEIITKGYLIKNFMASQQKQNWSLNYVSSYNIRYIFTCLGVNIFFSIALILISTVSSFKKYYQWFINLFVLMIFFLLSPSFPSHYFLGYLCMLSFILIITLSESKLGRILISFIFLYFLIKSIFFTAVPKPTRSINKIGLVVKNVLKSSKISSKDKIAVISILSKDVSVPQADDYRYFLRVSGYQVLDVVDYSKANRLLIFIELPDFEWRKWSSWELEQFGSKKLEDIKLIDGIKVLNFIKNPV